MSKDLVQTTDGDLTIIGDLTGTMERPKTLERGDLTGTEGISADEVRLPRLALAQGLSPQVTPGNERFIKNLTLFDMFNDLTETVYGKGPLTLVPVRRDVRRIEFIPRAEGGGVADLNVPKGDIRLRWTKSDPKLARADVPPAATEFVEFVVLLLQNGKAPEPILFSIAQKNKWNRRASDKMTTIIKLRPPIFANMFSVDTSVPGKNDKGTFAVPTIRDLGYVPKDTALGAALFEYAKQFAKSLEGKEIVVEREPGVDDDFDPAAIETEGKTEM